MKGRLHGIQIREVLQSLGRCLGAFPVSEHAHAVWASLAHAGYRTTVDAMGEVTSGSDRKGVSVRLRRFTGLGGCFCKLQRCGETWIGCLVNSRCGHL